MNELRWERLRHRHGLAMAAGLVALLFLPSLPALWHAWWDTGTFNHCLVVIPAAVWLIRERESANGAGFASVTSAASAGNPHAATGALAHYLPAGLLVLLALLWLAARLLSVQAVEQGAMVAMVPALAWYWNGNDWALRHRFALLFCLLATPAGEFLIPPLMELTADITVLLVKLSGLPVIRDGMRLHLASGDFVVAEACSGIRYLIATVTLGLLFAHLMYRSLRRKLWFMAAAVATPLLANGLRAWMMVMIAHATDLEYATGFDHLVYGWVFFGVVILLLFSCGARWSDAAGVLPGRPLATAGGPVAAEIAPVRAHHARAGAAMGLGVLLLASAPLAEWAVNRQFAAIDAQLPPAEFPAEVAGYRHAGPAAFPTPLVYPGADRIETALYRRPASADTPAAELHYALVRFVRDRPGHKFVSSVNQPWDFDWHRTASGVAPMAGGERHYDDLEPKVRDYGDDPGRPWRVYSWYAAAGETTQSPWRAKWLALRDWATARDAQPPPTVHLVAVPR